MVAADYRRLARQHLQGNYVTVLLVTLVYALLIGALGSMAGIGVLLLGGILSVGLCSALLSLVRTGSTRVEMLFDGFKQELGAQVVAYILQSVFLALWTLLFISPGIVKTFSYSMTFYILRDNPGISGTEAIDRSRKMMNGHKWELFCLYFSFIGWILLSMLSFGIGVLFLMPYMETARAEFYQNLKMQEECFFVNATPDGI